MSKRSFYNVSSGLTNIGECGHAHSDPAAAGRCAEQRLDKARRESGRPQHGLRLEVRGRGPGNGSAETSLSPDEAAAAADARTAEERRLEAASPAGSAAREALELERHRHRAARAMNPEIREALETTLEEARREGLTPIGGPTYIDRYGCGDVFTSREVRQRAAAGPNGEVRRYALITTTEGSAGRAVNFGWTPEAEAQAREAEYQASHARLDALRDDELSMLFGKGNEPNREYLRRRDVEQPYDPDEWEPASGRGRGRG